jgi:predicted RNase H-like HicB family nuclease
MSTHRYYPAVFYQDPESEVGVMFPDFPGCVTAGIDESDAYEMANEVLQFHIDSMLEAGEPLPEPSSLRNAWQEHAAEVGFQALVMIKAKLPAKAKRINITMDEHLLAEVDEAAAKRGLSRSLFLAEGARAMLSQRSQHEP